MLDQENYQSFLQFPSIYDVGMRAHIDGSISLNESEASQKKRQKLNKMFRYPMVHPLISGFTFITTKRGKGLITYQIYLELYQELWALLVDEIRLTR